MRRRNMIVIGGAGALGGGMFVCGTSYGSSNLVIERTDGGTVVRQNGEQIDSLSHSVTLVEDDDVLLGISIPDRATAARVAVGVVWAIRSDGLWSDITVELASTGDIRAPLDPGSATAYSSTWSRSPSEASGSTSARRRYAYPRGTTAGRADTLLSVQTGTDPEEALVELEARLSARSLGGARVELTIPAEMTYSPG